MKIYKKCTKCLIEKIEFDFYMRGERKDILRSHCKDCTNKKNRERAKLDRVKINKTATRRRHSNRGLTMLWMAKNRAIRKNLPFNIDENDVVIPEKCPVLGITLAPQIGKANDNSPSLDRIEPSKGYVKGNVLVVSRRANLLKNDASLEEIEMIYNFYKKLKAEGL